MLARADVMVKPKMFSFFRTETSYSCAFPPNMTGFTVFVVTDCILLFYRSHLQRKDDTARKKTGTSTPGQETKVNSDGKVRSVFGKMINNLVLLSVSFKSKFSAQSFVEIRFISNWFSNSKQS